MDTVASDFSQAKSFKGTVHIKIKVISASTVFLMMDTRSNHPHNNLETYRKKMPEMLYKLIPKSSLVCVILSLAVLGLVKIWSVSDEVYGVFHCFYSGNFKF